MDIEEAKKQLLKHKKEINAKFISARYSKAIEVVLSELDKKDKIIKDMANSIYFIDSMSEYGNSRDEVIDYFTNKVEEDIKE